MANELIEFLLRANLALAAAILVVLALRRPMRAVFGARIAYGLWLLPPLAVLMCLAPARRVVLPFVAEPAAPARDFTVLPPPAAAPVPLWEQLPLDSIGIGVWIAGALLSLVVLCVRQLRYLRKVGKLSPRAELGARVYAAQSPAAGPAVVGVLKPRIIMPADFDQRFDAAERDVVMAHERAHLAQRDPLINAAAALARCLAWFNPLVYFAERALRFDQELSCDAAVLGARAGVRRRYAEAMLKSHAPAFAAPLGCAWPSRHFHPMKERITMLKQALPSRARRLIGASVVTLAVAGVGAAAWMARPVELAYADAPRAVDSEDARHQSHAVVREDVRVVVRDGDEMRIVHNSSDGHPNITVFRNGVLLGAEDMDEASVARVMADFEAQRAEFEANFEQQARAFEEQARAFEAEAERAAELALQWEAPPAPPVPPVPPVARTPGVAPVAPTPPTPPTPEQIDRLRERARAMRIPPEEIARIREEARRIARESHAAHLAANRDQLAMQMEHLRAAQERLREQERELARARAEIDRQMARLQAEQNRQRDAAPPTPEDAR